MRLVAGMLVCLGVSAISLALADQPTTVPQAGSPAAATPTAAAPATAPAAVSAAPPSATPAAAVSTPAPAAATAPAASAPAKPALDPDEKRLMAMGYHARMRNGVKVFCRSEEVVGTRVSSVERCGTVADLKAAVAATQEDAEEQRRAGLRGNPSGK